jgi:hypothetical protein
VILDAHHDGARKVLVVRPAGPIRSDEVLREPGAVDPEPITVREPLRLAGQEVQIRPGQDVIDGP